jgi:hypothetical protein
MRLMQILVSHVELVQDLAQQALSQKSNLEELRWLFISHLFLCKNIFTGINRKMDVIRPFSTKKCRNK